MAQRGVGNQVTKGLAKTIRAMADGSEWTEGSYYR
jgi:hypothetical protein